MYSPSWLLCARGKSGETLQSAYFGYSDPPLQQEEAALLPFFGASAFREASFDFGRVWSHRSGVVAPSQSICRITYFFLI